MTTRLHPDQPIRNIIAQWANDLTDQRPLLLIGEKGHGKTILCQQLTKEDSVAPGLPMFLLDLRYLTGLHRRLPLRHEMIAECLARSFLSPMSYTDYERACFDSGALIMVDGLETALEQLTPHDGSVLVHEVLNFASNPEKCRLLVTCRPETVERFPSLAKAYKVLFPAFNSHLKTVA